MIATKFGEHGIQIMNVKMESDSENMTNEGKPIVVLSFRLKLTDQNRLFAAVDQINALDVVLLTEVGKQADASRLGLGMEKAAS